MSPHRTHINPKKYPPKNCGKTKMVDNRLVVKSVFNRLLS